MRISERLTEFLSDLYFDGMRDFEQICEEVMIERMDSTDVFPGYIR